MRDLGTAGRRRTLRAPATPAQTGRRAPGDLGAGARVGTARPPDNHVHTGWSWDPPRSVTMARACEQAIAQGLPAIAFTEHLDFTVWGPDDRATTLGLVDRHASRHEPLGTDGHRRRRH